MSNNGAQLSARIISELLARIFGPSFYDGPHFGHIAFVESARTSFANRRGEVALNPQPLPPHEAYAMAVADAYIEETVSLDRISVLWGGEVSQRALNQSIQQLADLDELCPRWPVWPKGWPPPPPPPGELLGEMTGTQLLLFGSRFLAAASAVREARIQDALVQLGEKAMLLSAETKSYARLQKTV